MFGRFEALVRDDALCGRQAGQGARTAPRLFSRSESPLCFALGHGIRSAHALEIEHDLQIDAAICRSRGKRPASESIRFAEQG
jgi:hypothetical protein